MKIDKELIDNLFEQANANLRFRQNFDLRTSAEDGSQRMLNALLPRKEIPVWKLLPSETKIINFTTA